VLTGVTRGFGREAADLLISNRPQDHYVLLARGDAELAAEGIRRSTGAGNLTGIACDLASLDDIRRAADLIGKQLDSARLAPLGGYLGNAGVVMTTTSGRTADGYEMTFGVNVLAHYLLVRLLLTRFLDPSWILLTTSDTHFGQFRYTLGSTPRPRWDAPKQLATPRSGGVQQAARAYATSKLAIIYLTHELARRAPDGVDVFSYNPSLVGGTELFRDARGLMRTGLDAFVRLQLAIGRGMTPQQAGELLAETILTAKYRPSGSYLDRGRVVPSSAESYDQQREQQLWREAAHLVGLG
jgi:NAD(P)-dependent dehydrogenase (short-subunit alcohol dehydrogenase family)